ncbi:putative oxidoreductase [Pseudooceanicola batsensis HTCC2597]|uniref:Putative oxidoreductase n=1 Tax=Pseudooceanicola batsensis (strain ATCC BAA-863 / DSM 15984 / KCTC 12145 / HTCC2597) TaxID=252305 RepID=A3U1K9_PSEBH|nr:nitronate monooxygenase [Pseudooceanicola batsensis]EAQ01790.1 putative oxidoreductase [Pseudooceanicola batsensis HTCC2597]
MIGTRLTREFGLRHPVVSAPMALAAGGGLAAAVTAAGGLGLIGGGYGDADWVETAFRDAGNARVGCGFITWKLAERPEVLTRALAHDPAALFLSFGDPAPFADEIAAAGVPLICQVQTLEHARHALASGARVIVAQGGEAGGHGATRATMTLVPEVADLLAREAPEVLLLAAGGIADGRGLAAALMLGADGVLVGTRLWASREALVPEAIRAAGLAADGDATLRSSLPDIARRLDWPAPFTIRTVENAFTRDWAADPEGLRARADLHAAYAVAARDGDATLAPPIAGEAVGLIHDVAPAGEIVARMAAEAEALLGGGWRR